MLGSIDPVIIFQFSALAPSLGTTLAKIPIAAKVPTLIEQPPIPIYLSEELFNIVIDGESKNVDIDTNLNTLTDGGSPDISQKGIQSGITIEIEGKRDSIALTLLAAMVDQAFDKVTSSEYAITYLHGPITIFRGLLNNFSSEMIQGTDKMSVKIGLTRGQKDPTKKPVTPEVKKATAVIPGPANV